MRRITPAREAQDLRIGVGRALVEIVLVGRRKQMPSLTRPQRPARWRADWVLLDL